jgi:hypothetical protein
MRDGLVRGASRDASCAAKVVTLAVAVLCLTGCSLFDGLTKPIERASQNVKDAAGSLAKGMADLDPIALKSLVQSNESLRKQLDSINSRISSLQGSGAVEISNRDVRVKVSRYNGTVRLNGWVDARENWFWQDRGFFDQAAKLPANFQLDAWFKNRPCANYECWMADLSKRVSEEADRGFSAFLSTSAIVPGPEAKSIDLNTRFGGSGNHTITVVATPYARDAAGRWAVVLQFILTAQSGKEEVIAEYEQSSDMYPSHRLGQPLPPVSMLVRVRTQ